MKRRIIRKKEKKVCQQFESIAKAQMSIEYLILTGFLLMLLIPAIYLAYTYTNSLSYEATGAQMAVIGKRIIDNIEYIYPYGKDTKTTVSFELPARIINISVRNSTPAWTGYELYAQIDIEGKNHTMVFFTDIPIYMGNCSEQYGLSQSFIQNQGKKRILVQSCGKNVSIQEG